MKKFRDLVKQTMSPEAQERAKDMTRELLAMTPDRPHGERLLLNAYGRECYTAGQQSIQDQLQAALARAEQAEKAMGILEDQVAMLNGLVATHERKQIAAEVRAEQAEKERDEWKGKAEWQGEITKSLLPYQERAVEAEAARARLLPYVQHKDGCEAWPQFTGHFQQASKVGKCTCGLDEALK